MSDMGKDSVLARFTEDILGSEGHRLLTLDKNPDGIWATIAYQPPTFSASIYLGPAEHGPGGEDEYLQAAQVRIRATLRGFGKRFTP